MRKFTSIERFLNGTVLGDFYRVLKTPVDKKPGRVIGSYDYKPTIRKLNQNFTYYVLNNLITSTKNKTETTNNVLKTKAILSFKRQN